MSRVRFPPARRLSVPLLAACVTAALVAVVAPAPAAAGPRDTAAATAASAGPRPPSDPAAQLTTGMMPPNSPDAVRAGPGGAVAHTAGLSPNIAYLQGVDVASYQHPGGHVITWTAVRAAGRGFAVIKASEGTTYVNGYLAGDAAGARSAGLSIGLYHFARPALIGGSPTGDAVAEADHFAAEVKAVGGAQLPPTVDLEVSGGLTAPQLIAWTSTFLSRFQADTLRHPMIYTGPYFWNTALAGSRSFTTYPLWEAHYTTAAQPASFGGWSSWTFWQYSDGTYAAPPAVPGISALVDRDRYVSSAAALVSLAVGSAGNVAPYTGTASAATYPNGTFVQVSGSGGVYEIAGLAPLFLSSWSLVGGMHPVRVLSLAQFYSLRSSPLDGTFISAVGTGRIYRVAGGAPLYVTSWATLGRSYPSVPIGAAAVANAGSAGPYSHLRAHPADGTFLASSGGGVYRTAGGAPVYVSSWAYFGGVQPYTLVSGANIWAAGSPVGGGVFEHLLFRPVEGTNIEAATSGSLWTVSGGHLVPTTGAGRTFVIEGDTAIAARGLAGAWAHLA